MDAQLDKLNEFTVNAIEILTNKNNEFVNHRKSVLVLFQYLTAPHYCVPHEISISDLFETENFHVDSVSLFTSVTKLIFETNLHYELKNNLVKYIIQQIKVVPSEELKFILFEQWSKNRLACLPSKILESVISEVHLCLEESILSLVETVCISSVEDEIICMNLNRNDIKCIIHLSSISAIIFQNSITILHELLILSNVHKNILLVVSAFVSAVFERCKTSIVHLFPLEIQEMVIILQRDPYQLDDVTKQIVLKRIYDSLKSNQSASTALITYFPKWFPYILGDTSMKIEKKHWLIFFQIIQVGTILQTEFRNCK